MKKTGQHVRVLKTVVVVRSWLRLRGLATKKGGGGEGGREGGGGGSWRFTVYVGGAHCAPVSAVLLVVQTTENLRYG